MLEIRFHGRGGQGVVTAAELLSVAAFVEGQHAQAIPSFGSERTGAPVVSFCRLHDAPIRAHDPIVTPDVVVVGDATLLHQVDVFGGLRSDGYVLINTSRSADELGLGDLSERVSYLITVPATELAREHLGRPLPNAALLGAFSALTGAVSLASVQTAILHRFAREIGERNAAAARAAFAHVRSASGSPILALGTTDDA
jgi:pyruvate ferredoxin oxidoreductase gamma subunit